ncbi:hypothetical protein [Methylobacterium sp. sgz302541]|uniref:hypothetical protein n=1 Tax=unclassified Methylobacterium TaxID=2615210 RepID=UPI003D348519
MPSHRHPARPRLTTLCLGLALAASVSGAALAQGEPPIKSAQDAACRDEARDRVFSTPDPQGIGLQAIGRQIYTACMQRAARAGGGTKRARHAH